MHTEEQVSFVFISNYYQYYSNAHQPRLMKTYEDDFKFVVD